MHKAPRNLFLIFKSSFIPFYAGLAHLHSLSPRLVHKDFKTANVLVDENFITKVADAGLRNFLGRAEIAGPSSLVAADEIFLAPEYGSYVIFATLVIQEWILSCENLT